MNSGRTIPREPDVPAPERHVQRFGGDGRIDKTSAFVRPSAGLSGVPNSVRRDREKMRRAMHARDMSQGSGLPDWLANAQVDRSIADGTIMFPPPLVSEPGLDYLGRPTGRRRGGLR